MLTMLCQLGPCHIQRAYLSTCDYLFYTRATHRPWLHGKLQLLAGMSLGSYCTQGSLKGADSITLDAHKLHGRLYWKNMSS